MIDFFVSYNGADRSWAEWIAWYLEQAGYAAVSPAKTKRPTAYDGRGPLPITRRRKINCDA
ncbi:MAG: toll/interleukin-1 receptor domain-containing protein [Bryobacteraceae bacterium]|jgi:hypothetical protein